MAIKVAFIGAGSLGFTRGLLRDLLAVPELRDTRFGFTDIDAKALTMVTQLCRRDIRENRLPARIVSTTDRRRALDGADYVVNCVRVGGLDAFQTDIDIPLRYGVDQCVGDTLCAGGIMYGQRNIPCLLDFCRDIRQVAAPNALLLNYANPNAMNCWAASHHGGVPTVGLCHGVAGGWVQIAAVIEHVINKGKGPGSRGYKPVMMEEVHVVAAGINHQTWFLQVIYDGQDWCERLLAGYESHPVYRTLEKVRIDMLRRFGYYSTESNGHLSEYLPWYRKRLRDVTRWIDTSAEFIHGETGGYLRCCIEGHRWFRHDYRNFLKRPMPPIGGRTGEHAGWIIESLETGRPYRGHFNVVNRGAVSNLPADAIVEVPGYVDRNGISIPSVGPLPTGCAAVCNASISVQRLAVEAAVRGDVTLLKQAMMMDPLVGAVCDPNEISQMTDEMLVAQARWLPQYRREIPAARKRLAAEKSLAWYKGPGAVRIQPRTVAQLARDPARARTQVPRSWRRTRRRAPGPASCR